MALSLVSCSFMSWLEVLTLLMICLTGMFRNRDLWWWSITLWSLVYFEILQFLYTPKDVSYRIAAFVMLLAIARSLMMSGKRSPGGRTWIRYFCCSSVRSIHCLPKNNILVQFLTFVKNITANLISPSSPKAADTVGRPRERESNLTASLEIPFLVRSRTKSGGVPASNKESSSPQTKIN